MNKDGEPELGRPAKRVLRSNAALRNATTSNPYRATVADEPEVDVSMHTAAAEEADVDISMRDASQAAQESNMDISMRDASNGAAEQSNMDVSMRDASPRGPASGDVSMSVESSEGQVNQPYSGPSATSSFDVPDDYEFSFNANASLPGQHLSPPGTASSFNPDSLVHGSPLGPAATAPVPAEQDALPALSEANSMMARPNESQQILRNVVREEILDSFGAQFSAISTSLQDIQTTQKEQQTALNDLRAKSTEFHSELREECKGQAKERLEQANERTQATQQRQAQDNERQAQANERQAQEDERQAQADERQAQSQERVDQGYVRTLVENMNEEMIRENRKANTERTKAGNVRARQLFWLKNKGPRMNLVYGKGKTVADTRPNQDMVRTHALPLSMNPED